METRRRQAEAKQRAASAEPAYDRFRGWMRRAALPFWADRGTDPTGAGFEEHLTVAGERDDVAFKRVRVQARQVYVYSHAALLGWPSGLAIATRGYAFLMGAERRADGGWPSRLDRRGAAADQTADLYDIAFVLLALAFYARAGGEAGPIAEAHDTLDWLEAHMAGAGGGFVDGLPRRDGWRRQNPHMHLLEAALALFETSGEPRFLDLARRLVGLFRERFFDPATGTLGEVFAEDWSMAPGPAGRRVEPGHHYEWVWLLAQYEAVTGDDVSDPMRALYDFADQHGADRGSGLVVDAVDRSGAVVDRSVRIWPQTEAIRAHLVMRRRGGRRGGALRNTLDRQVDALFAQFLDRGPAGAWRDHFDAEGRLRSEVTPASSFYHLFTAYAEMARILDPGARRPLEHDDC